MENPSTWRDYWTSWRLAPSSKSRWDFNRRGEGDRNDNNKKCMVLCVGVCVGTGLLDTGIGSFAVLRRSTSGRGCYTSCEAKAMFALLFQQAQHSLPSPLTSGYSRMHEFGEETSPAMSMKRCFRTRNDLQLPFL